MNAELIAVGTELLLGDTINTDAAAVARLLSELGINVYWQTVVGDNRARLEQAVQLARTRADLIITTGGLGPTCDDLTKEVVAGAFGIPLELNKAEEERLRGLYRVRHTYMTENHLQQVMLPRSRYRPRRRSSSALLSVSGIPNAPAPTSLVRSSHVGPRPPVVMMRSARVRASCTACSSRARLSPTTVCQ